MAETEPATVASTFFARDLFLFLCAVLVGTTAGIGSQQALLHLTSPQIAANLSLALATTFTGAAHSRLVHRKPLRLSAPEPRRRHAGRVRRHARYSFDDRSVTSAGAAPTVEAIRGQ